MTTSRKFSKRDRLLDKEDFDAVFESAHLRAIKEKNIIHLPPYVIYRLNLGTTPRIGISIARRIIKRAHERNRIKRLIREFFRANKTGLAGDYIIRVVSRPKTEDSQSIINPLYKMVQNQNRENNASR